MSFEVTVKFFLLFLLASLVTVSEVLPQTTQLSFTSIPIANADINAPGRGVEQWHDRNDVNVPVEGTNTPRLDVYYRFVWTKIEGPTLGSYTWTFFDNLVNTAILNKQKFSFGIMTVYPGGTTENGLVSYDGGNSSYPLYLHTLMQGETVKDWRTGSTWTPNYNSTNYQNRLLALNQAIDAHIKTTSFNGVPYRNVIGCIDIRGYGAWGEWHSGYTPNNVISDYPAGTFPTIASLKKIVDAHTQGFPDFQLVAMIAAFDAQWLQNTWNPPEIAYYVLTQRNNLGLIGWRRDQWGATDSYLASYLENNTRSFGGLVFRDSIMVRWKSTPITGEPPGWNPSNFSDLERQVKLYHAASFGNGNYGVTPSATIKNNVRAASKACGYRLILESGNLTLNGSNLTIALNWKNTGQAPTYENWDVVYELKNGSTTAWTGVSQFKPKLFQPLATATLVTDNFTSVPAGIYNLNIIVKDPNGYRDPLPLAINGRNADGSYTLATQMTIQSSAPAPAVAVTNNCGNTILTASGYTGTLLWSTGESSPSITVTNPGTYTVTQTVSGSTSAPGTGVAAPKLIPLAPVVTVTDNCNNSLLSATGTNLLWNTLETSSSITVTTGGTYTVTQTVGGCTSASGSGTAAPKTIPVAPGVTVVNNCGNSVLTATGSNLSWSTGATIASITVTTPGTYTVTQTVNGCTSPAASGVAAPVSTPVPVVTVANNCGNSVLSTTGTNLLWSTGETSSSITVTNNATYTVTQTVNNCTSAAGSGTSAPKTVPLAPVVAVTDNCGNSVLNTSGSNLSWSTGETSSSITVTSAGTYTVTQTVGGCTSASGSGTATPKTIPVAPGVTVINNCGNSELTATGTTGALLWSNGATTTPVTVTTAATYTVTQTVGGCTSASGSIAAAPKAVPSAPVVTVANDCDNSVLSTTGTNLLWSTGETSSSITVTNNATYTVTQTVNNCTSATGSGTSAPKTIPGPPTVTVVNNCGNSVLTATGTNLHWSTGETTASITVTTAGIYTVTQTVNGCESAAASKDAAPFNSAVDPPTVSVVNNCGNSVLTATGTNLHWITTGETTASITVTSGGTYTVTQTVNGCTSPAASISANPIITPTPVITVSNNCGNSVLSTTGTNLLWSTGETSSSITVTNNATYTVTQTVNNCTSAAGSGTSAPKTVPLAPVVAVTDNCGNSVLNTSGSNLSWSTGETSSSITVTSAGTYTVTQTAGGCTSASGSGTATPKTIPVAPGVTVINNCGSSELTATGTTGTLLWSNGATTTPVTVSTAATYTVTQTVNGCTSASGSGVAAPKAIPSAPSVTVNNECNSSVLTASGSTGNFIWSTGETTESITVTAQGTYNARQTDIATGCTSAATNGVANPKANPAPPTVTVVNNCGNSVLTATGANLHWSTGETTASIMVTTAGTYTVTQTVNGCESAAASKDAAPFNSAVDPPTVSVVNNCGNSVLTATGTNLHWITTGETTASITVTSGGTYTVTQTVNGCTSPAASGVAVPVSTPAPVVTVANNCGNSVLSTTGTNLLWSTGETSSSITVTNNATYTVTQTVNNCTSAAGSGTSAPKIIPGPPTVTVVNNCGNSVLTATGTNLHWSTGETTASIMVTTAGTYTVTQTVNGCESAAASKDAAPFNSAVDPPTVSVVNNCGNSVLTATGTNLHWITTGETTASITVTSGGTYTVTQTVNGCTSPAANGVAAPVSTPAPVVTVANNCGNSVLSTTGTNLVWSTGETSSSITVTNNAIYTVTQTVNNCTSAAGSGTSAPKTVPLAPVVAVSDNCGNSVLNTSGSNLSWSTGETSSSITVTSAGTYTVTQTVGGCTSASGSGTATPKTIPVAPGVTVINNCGNSELTATGTTGTLLWSNGATTTPITVSTAATYTVTQTVNGCTSASGSITAAPKVIPPAPVVTVANNCGNSVLSTTGTNLLWSTGETSSSITVTNNATYTVTQTVNSCTSTAGSGTSAPKIIPGPPTVTVVNNCGNSVLTATGTNLHWSTGETTASIMVTTAGTYTVTQTVNGCESAAASKDAAPFNSAVDPPTVSVVNNCGNSVLTATGTNLHWITTGETTASITVTSGGTYTVTQTVNGCTSPAANGVAAPVSTPAPVVTVANNCGNSVLSTTGTNLVWSTGETSSSITVTNNATYTVTQTVNNCTSAAGSGTSAPKTVPLAPVVAVSDNCGSSVLNTSGSNLSWSTGETSSSITVTSAGTYTVTQTVGGCTSASGSGTATPKTIPVAPGVTVINNCGNSELTATGTTGTLLWSNGATTTPITVSTAATYTVTQTVNGCTSASGSITAAPKVIPPAPVVTVANNCGNSVLSTTGTNLVWSTGETSSSITVTNNATYTVTQTVNSCTSTAGSGTSAPKTIPSAPGVTVINNCGNSVLTATGTNLHWSTGETTASITVTTAGTYTVTQTVNGCESAAASKDAAPFNSAVDPPTVSVVNNCGNSVLTATGTNLHWITTGETTASITVTSGGTYTVTQTVNGCTSPAANGVAAPVSTPAPVVTVANNCGNSVLSTTGTNLLWSTGETSSSITVTNNATYTVTQTVNNCTSAAGSGTSAPKTVPLAPVVAVTDNCGNSVLSTTGTSLLWSPTGATTTFITVATAGTHTVTQTVNGCTSGAGSGTAAPKAVPSAPVVTVTNNCGNSVLSTTGTSLLWSPTGATTTSITVATAGTHTVTQTVNGCTSGAGSGTAAPKAVPSAPVVTVTNNCGNSVLSATGTSLLWSPTGATTASITVSTAATHTVTQTVNGCTSTAGSGTSAPKTVPSAPVVTVTNNCGNSVLSTTGTSLLWSPTGATTASITVATAGTHTVTQTVNGCTSAAGSGTAAPTGSVAVPTVTVVNNCGSSVLTASGFTGSLLWSNGATAPSITVSNAGTYTVTQTINGCTSAVGSGVAAPLTTPAPGVTVTNNCGNSVLTATGTSGAVLWSNGATTTSITVTTAATYSVTQTVNGCTSAAGSGVAAPKATPAAPAVTVVNNCGNSVLTATGTTGTLLWSPTGATTASITVATAGTHTVTQTVNGCTSAAGSGTAAPTGGTVTVPTVTVVNNCGNSVLTATGTTGTILWSNGATTASITVTTAATYTVTQTVNGCTSAAGSGVAAPKATPAAPTVTVVNNCGNSVLTATGTTGTVLWSNGATTASITVTTAATYTVRQTVNGCPSATASGVAAPKATPAAPTVTVVNNCGNSVLTASAFTGSLLWSTGATTASITVTTAATYTVTQTVNGCTSTTRSATAAPKATPAAPTISVANNCGNSVLTASAFTGTLLWSTGATTSSITVTTGATYTVTQTVSGCTSATRSATAAPKAVPVLSSSLTVTAFSGKVMTYVPTSSISGTTFAWSRAAVTGISNAAASGTGNVSESLVNTTTSAKTVTYVYTLTANGCTNTQNVVVTVNAPAATNCVISASLTSSFNSTSIPSGRYIWFNSVFSRGSLSGVTGTVTFLVTNSKITFTANSVQYTLNVPSSRIRYDAAVTSASTQFLNGIWETAIPRTYGGDVFMGGLAYLVPSNLPGSISNIVWTANVSIDKPGISLTWEWAAAVYTSFAAHAGLNIKPKDESTQNPYPNNDNAGTPENFKSSVVSGAKGSGGTNYTGSYSSSSSAACTVNTGQRPSAQPVITQQPSFPKQLPAIDIERLKPERLEIYVLPNPSNNYFNLFIRGINANTVKVRVIDVSGRVVEVHESVPSNTMLRVGERLASGSYFVEVTQNDERRNIKVMKFD